MMQSSCKMFLRLSLFLLLFAESKKINGGRGGSTFIHQPMRINRSISPFGRQDANLFSTSSSCSSSADNNDSISKFGLTDWIATKFVRTLNSEFDVYQKDFKLGIITTVLNRTKLFTSFTSEPGNLARGLREAANSILSHEERMERKLAPIAAEIMAIDSNPMVVFVNRKSGGKSGSTLLTKLGPVLKAAQLCDVSKDKPSTYLKLFQQCPNLRVLICGGDGTVSWVMDEVKRTFLVHNCTFGILPLGTGNDLYLQLRDVAAVGSSSSSGSSSSGSSSSGSSSSGSSSSSSGSTSSGSTSSGSTSSGSSSGGTNPYGTSTSSILSDTVTINNSTNFSALPSSTSSSSSSSSSSSITGSSITSSTLPKHRTTISPREMIAEPKLLVNGYTRTPHAGSLLQLDRWSVGVRRVYGRRRKLLKLMLMKTRVETRGKGILGALAGFISKFWGFGVRSKGPSGQMFTSSKEETSTDEMRIGGIMKGDNTKNDVMKGETISLVKPRGEIMTGEITTGERMNEATTGAKMSDDFSVNTPSLPLISPVGKPKQGELLNLTMNNYFGVGVDGAVSLGFHNMRKRVPVLFFHRWINKLWYGLIGARTLLLGWNLSKCCQLKCDGKLIDIPSGTQGIIVLNVNSYAGGSKMWTPSRQDLTTGKFKSADIADGQLEIVAVTGVNHLGAIKAGLRKAIPLAQGHHVHISSTSSLPMQIDGEPWRQRACKIEFSLSERVPIMMPVMPDNEDPLVFDYSNKLQMAELRNSMRR